jgi:hypothetical protein
VHHELLEGVGGKLQLGESFGKMLQHDVTRTSSIDLSGMKQQLSLPPVMWLGSVRALGSTTSYKYFDSMP